MSDFLKKLNESVKSGVPNEAIVGGFNEILTKADRFANHPGKMELIREKAEKVEESRKPLTLDEIKELEFLAMKQQQKIDEFEFQTTLQAALVNVDLAIEKLTIKIKEFMFTSSQLRDESIPVAEKKELVKELLKAISSIETPAENHTKFTIGDDDKIYGEDKTIYDDEITE